MGLQRVGHDLVTEQKQCPYNVEPVTEENGCGKKMSISLNTGYPFIPSTNIEQQTNARNRSRYENQRCLGGSPCLCEIYILLGGLFGEGNGNPLQYSCLENPVDREAWWPAIYGVAASQT